MTHFDALVLAIRLVNAALLIGLLIGLTIGWWRHRDEVVQPLGIATLAFAIATTYGSLEAILLNAPSGGRPLLLLFAVVIANICVWLPILTKPKEKKP